MVGKGKREKKRNYLEFARDYGDREETRQYPDESEIRMTSRVRTLTLS